MMHKACGSTPLDECDVSDLVRMLAQACKTDRRLWQELELAGECRQAALEALLRARQCRPPGCRCLGIAVVLARMTAALQTADQPPLPKETSL